MRSLFWRIFASFWLAIALVAGLSMLLGRALNQDAWVLSLHPGLDDLDRKWVKRYEQQGPHAAQQFLEQRKQKYRINTQVIGESGQPLVKGTFPPRAAAFEARHSEARRLPWRRLTAEYTSPESGDSYLFIYRIPHPELAAWHRGSLFWPLSALGIALVVLTLFSLLLTLSITRPLDRLRGAVHDLGQTAYQQNSLARLATRGDELGLLAKDFNRMGERLQGLIGSQRQLLRDVSHELRSPLARLRIALALAIHVVGWGLLLGTLLVFGPRFDSFFRDYGLKLPWVTEQVMWASQFVWRFWPVAITAFFLSLAVDGAVMFLASRLRETLWLGRIWAVIVALVPLFGLLLVWAALLYPWMKLLEGMSR